MQVLDDTLGLEEERDMIDGGDVVHTDDLLGCYVTEHGDLGFCRGFKRFCYDQPTCDLVASSITIAVSMMSRAYQIGEETKSTEGVDGGLRWFCLLFTVHIGDQRHVDKCKVLVTNTGLELPHGLDERC